MTLNDLLPRLETKLKLVIGRHRLYMLLAIMKTEGEIVTTGRGDRRAYALAKRRT